MRRVADGGRDSDQHQDLPATTQTERAFVMQLQVIVEEAYADPALVKSAPHAQPIAQIKSGPLEDPAQWAMTWRAWQRKKGG